MLAANADKRPTHLPQNHRVRPFKRGDEIASDAKKRKLQREFIHTSELANLIYWTDVGRVGYEHFKQQLREKTMASRMCATIPGEVSAEKAHKMLRKSMEVQSKADAERVARAARSRAANSTSPRRAYGGRNNNGKRGQRAARNPRQHRAAARSNSRAPPSRRPTSRKSAPPSRRA